MKPKRISKHSYSLIYRALIDKARVLSQGKENLRLWFSSARIPQCLRGMEGDPGRNFIVQGLDQWQYALLHFLPVPCDDQECLEEEAICLMKVNSRCLEDENACVVEVRSRYYLHTHKVGHCPWKKRHSEAALAAVRGEK